MATASTSKPIDAKVMASALAVKRGETKLADLPEKQRETVQKAMRTMKDSQLRTYAASTVATPGRRVGRLQPQSKIRRARSY